MKEPMKRKGDWIMPSEGNREAPRGEPAWWIAQMFSAGKAEDGSPRPGDPLLRYFVPASAKSPGFVRIKRDFNGDVCAIHRRDFNEWMSEQRRSDAERRLRGRHSDG